MDGVFFLFFLFWILPLVLTDGGYFWLTSTFALQLHSLHSFFWLTDSSKQTKSTWQTCWVKHWPIVAVWVGGRLFCVTNAIRQCQMYFWFVGRLVDAMDTGDGSLCLGQCTTTSINIYFFDFNFYHHCQHCHPHPQSMTSHFSLSHSNSDFLLKANVQNKEIEILYFVSSGKVF